VVAGVPFSRPGSSAPPPRPPAWEERLTSRLFLALSPRLPRTQPVPPPRHLAPWESVEVPRPGRRGTLSATWFPAAAGSARGAVLLLPPWLKWGQIYLFRQGRIEALRAAGYHVLTLDLGGFGNSAPSAGYFFDHDVADGLACLRQRAGDGLPLHVWGLSSGGFWAHLVLSRADAVDAVSGAMFEDVSPHLLEWSWRMLPRLRPGYFFFRTCLRRSYRYLDLRRHAGALRTAAVAYVGGGADTGVLPAETADLARRAGARCLVVPGAPHLAAFGEAKGEVIALALDTFRAAEAARKEPQREEGATATAVPVAAVPAAPAIG
jgi:alpha-beta hydrolase superfamily lysophospholipase